MDIAILVLLILMNGMFAMAEIALLTARRNRLQAFARRGDKAAAAALELSNTPTRFLSTVQVGITSIGILNGIVGEATLAKPLAGILQRLGIGAETSALGATALVVIGLTYLTIVIGELVPKRLAQLHPEGIARFLARPVGILASLTRPFVWLLSASTERILRLLGAAGSGSTALTKEDIQAMLREGSRTGLIEQDEHAMVRNVFQLDERQIASLMTPRSEIVYLDLAEPLDKGMAELVDSNHSRFLVCRDGLDDVLGIITAKRLLRLHIAGSMDSIQEHLQPVIYVPESLTGLSLLQQFRESGVQIVIVVDEYGEILGLITLQDVLEALAGEFRPRDPEDVWAVMREDGSWLLDGLIPVPELKDRLSLRHVPGEDTARYNTLAGMLMWLIGKVPRTGDIAQWEQWRFEVVDIDGHRIDKVLASRMPENNSTRTNGS
jgi:putative hemolysin